jgi:hypothetical protein
MVRKSSHGPWASLDYTPLFAMAVPDVRQGVMRYDMVNQGKG